MRVYRFVPPMLLEHPLWTTPCARSSGTWDVAQVTLAFRIFSVVSRMDAGEPEETQEKVNMGEFGEGVPPAGVAGAASQSQWHWSHLWWGLGQ